jgi:enamine deaminase RidA (YjgF/YER057c/UK114 family)
MQEIIRKASNQRMSRIVIHNGTAYFCGQVAKEMVQDIRRQTRTMLEKVDELLDSVGVDRKAILTATIYLKNIEDFAGMNEVWDAWTPAEHAPARACVEARMARDEILVEISIVAAVSPAKKQ